MFFLAAWRLDGCNTNWQSLKSHLQPHQGRSVVNRIKNAHFSFDADDGSNETTHKSRFVRWAAGSHVSPTGTKNRLSVPRFSGLNFTRQRWIFWHGLEPLRDTWYNFYSASSSGSFGFKRTQHAINVCSVMIKLEKNCKFWWSGTALNGVRNV